MIYKRQPLGTSKPFPDLEIVQGLLLSAQVNGTRTLNLKAVSHPILLALMSFQNDLLQTYAVLEHEYKSPHTLYHIRKGNAYLLSADQVSPDLLTLKRGVLTPSRKIFQRAG